MHVSELVRLELELVRFYHGAFSEEIRWDAPSNFQCLQAVKEAYCKRSLQDRLSEPRFGHPGMRCAYIFLNTPCFSSTVALHFLGLLRRNPWLLRDSVLRGSLSVCCLGGGPATELVALLKVLEFALRPSRLGPLLVRATVVDVDPGWQSTARWITQNWWKHVDTSLVKLRVSFVRADLTDPLGEEVRAALAGSDVVTMVKFLSAVFGSSRRDKIPAMLQEISNCMPLGSVLFFMNCARFNCYQALSDVISSAGHMETIYGPVPDCVHRLSGPAFEECFRFYYRYYPWQTPTLENKSQVTAWVKRVQQRTPQ